MWGCSLTIGVVSSGNVAAGANILSVKRRRYNPTGIQVYAVLFASSRMYISNWDGSIMPITLVAMHFGPCPSQVSQATNGRVSINE
jgi:hypothetical protein